MTTIEEPHDEGPQRRAAAERDGLRELFAVFTHDLSNPLQSLTVLCELALSEAPEGSEPWERASQSLEATQRMNALVLAVSKVARGDGPRHLRGMLDRVLELFAHRFDRYAVDVRVETGDIDAIVPPAGFEQILLNLTLAAIASFTTQRRLHGFSLAFRGSRPSPALQPRHCALDITLDVTGDDGARHRLTVSDAHRARIHDLVAPQADVSFEHGDALCRLSFDGTEG